MLQISGCFIVPISGNWDKILSESMGLMMPAGENVWSSTSTCDLDKNTKYPSANDTQKARNPSLKVNLPRTYRLRQNATAATMKNVRVPCSKLIPFIPVSTKNHNRLRRAVENRTTIERNSKDSEQNIENDHTPPVILSVSNAYSAYTPSGRNSTFDNRKTAMVTTHKTQKDRVSVNSCSAAVGLVLRPRKVFSPEPQANAVMPNKYIQAIFVITFPSKSAVNIPSC